MQEKKLNWNNSKPYYKRKQFSSFNSERSIRRVNIRNYIETNFNGIISKRYNNIYYSNDSWNRRKINRYIGHNYEKYEDWDYSQNEWLKSYKDMLWDNYDDVKLDSFNSKLENNNRPIRYFSNIIDKNKDHHVSNDIIIQQQKLFMSNKKKVCINCLKIHYPNRCNIRRCFICSSRYHSSINCVWKNDPDEHEKLCKFCKGGCYNLNIYSNYIVNKKPVCNNYNSLDYKSCINKQYENSILFMGDKDNNLIKKNLQIECYKCSNKGHLICQNDAPYKDIIKTTYCALCGYIGHNYRLCNKYIKFKYEDTQEEENNIYECIQNRSTVSDYNNFQDDYNNNIENRANINNFNNIDNININDYNYNRRQECNIDIKDENIILFINQDKDYKNDHIGLENNNINDNNKNINNNDAIIDQNKSNNRFNHFLNFQILKKNLNKIISFKIHNKKIDRISFIYKRNLGIFKYLIKNKVRTSIRNKK